MLCFDLDLCLLGGSDGGGTGKRVALGRGEAKLRIPTLCSVSWFYVFSSTLTGSEKLLCPLSFRAEMRGTSVLIFLFAP